MKTKQLHSPEDSNPISPRSHTEKIKSRKDIIIIAEKDELEKGPPPNKNKITFKIIDDENSPSYYDNFPIKPGFQFMKELFFSYRNGNAKSLEKLRLNVPNTFFFDMGLYYLYNGNKFLNSRY